MIVLLTLFTFGSCLTFYGGIFSKINESLVVHQNERSRSPANWEYLGMGYDIFQGDPFHRGVDPGFRIPIFNISPEPNLNPVDWGIIQPKGVFSSFAESCEISFISNEIETKSDYYSMATEVVDVNVHGKYKGYEGSLSVSHGSISTQQATSMANLKFVYSYATCEIYRARIREFNQPTLSKDFLNAVESLPSTFSKSDIFSVERYVNFFKTFGTHVISSVSMGSRLVIVSSFSSGSWSSMKSEGWSIGVTASFGMNKVTKKGKISIGVDYSEQETHANSFMSQTKNYDIYSIGARPPEDGDSQKWAHDSRLNPMPIHYSTIPISQYTYIVGNEIKYLIEDAEKRNSIDIASKNYLDYLRLKSSLKDKDVNFQCDTSDSIIYRGKCLKFFDDLRTYYAANDACEEWGGNLVTFRDIEENVWILMELTTEEVWVGLNDFESPNVFRLPSGNVVEFTNWASGEPTHMIDPLEECVHTHQNTGLWNDIWCFAKKRYICEKLYIGAEHEKVSTSECDDGILFDNSTCVKAFSGGENWYEARFKCRQWNVNADLVSIMTEEKNEFLLSYAASQGLYQFWIGLSDHLKNLAWRWVGNGKYMVFQNNEGAWTSNYCMYADIPTYQGRWATWNCNARSVISGFICEKPFSS